MKLSAAAHLSNEQLMQGVKAAVQHGNAEAVKQLCELPAAKQLSREAVARLLRTAEQHGKQKQVQ